MCLRLGKQADARSLKMMSRNGFINPFSKYSLSTNSVPGTALFAGGTAWIKHEVFMESAF